MESNILKKSFSWDYLDKITTQGLSLIISIVLARLIEPEQYGIIAMATIFTQFLDAFINPGFTSALIQKKSPDKIDYSTVFWSNIVVSAILYLIIFTIAPVIESFYKMSNLTQVIRILSLCLPFSSINSVMVAYVRKNTMYKKYFFASFLGTFISGGVAIATAYIGFGIWSLVIYNLGNCVLDAFFSLIFISWKPSLEFSKKRFKSLYSFGGKMLYIKMIDIIYTEISGLIIGKKYTAADLSYYKKGRSYPQTIIQNLSMSISDVLFPMFSEIQNDKEKIKSALKEACSICDFIIYPMAIGFLACGDNFVEVFLTTKWLPCVPFLRVMCLYYLCTPSSGIMLQALKALGKASVLLKVEFIKKGYSLLLIVLSMVIFNSPLAITVAITVSGFITLALNLGIVHRFTGYTIVDYIKSVFPIAGISLAMLCGVMALNCLNLNVYLTLLLQVVVGIIIYFGLALIFKLPQIKATLAMIKGK